MNRAAADRPHMGGRRPGSRFPLAKAPKGSKAVWTTDKTGFRARTDDLVDQLSASVLAVALDQELGSRTSHNARVTRDRSKILVEFEESDFSISITRDVSRDSFRSRLSANVRAPEPDLSTWWTEWRLSGDAGALVDLHLESIQTHRNKFIEMVRGHLNGRFAG